MTKKNIYMIDLLCQIKTLLLDTSKLFKIPDFFQNISNSRFLKDFRFYGNYDKIK